MKRIELLAPAGDKYSLKAAVNNGADAVYLGAKAFSARESASNFTISELLEAIDYCHLHGVRLYAAVNTLLKDKEMEKAIELVRPLYEAGIDAIIMQDFGAADVIKSTFKGLPLHTSTQLGVHNASGAKWAEEFGFARAILSREVTIQGISNIKKNTGIELEAFVHGALCSSFSGQCLFSSFLGGRSGNRGRCAQPCRLFYELYDKDKKINSGYLLSTKEMCTLTDLKQLMDAGVSSFKIEGRARRGEYVSLAVRSYRKAIDSILEGRALNGKELLEDLMRMYNRGGFTSGYYFGNRDITATERPNNWGVLIGYIEKTEKDKMFIKSEVELNVGDGLEFVGKSSNGSLAVKDIEKIKPGLYAINSLSGVLTGDRVYRNTDAKLLEREKSLIEKEKQIGLKAAFCAKIGEYAELIVTDDKGNTAKTQSRQKVEKNLKPFDMEKEAKRSIEKTGGTAFNFIETLVTAEKESWLPLSEIANMRKTCLMEINEKRLAMMRLYEAREETEYNKNTKKEISSIKRHDRIVIVQTGEIERIETAFESGAYKVFVTPKNFNEEYFKKIKDFHKNREIYIKMPVFMMYNDEKAIEEIFVKYADAFSGAVISHITQLNLAKKYFKNIIAGSEVNIFNSDSARYLRENGVDSCVLSSELNIAQAADIKAINKYLTVQGKITLMNLPHCPLYEKRKCNCKGLEDVYLKDRKGYMLPLKREKVSGCNIKVLNGVDLCALTLMDEIKKTDINGYLIIDEDYSKEKLKELVKAYRKAITGEITEESIALLSKETTRGHLKKGVF